MHRLPKEDCMTYNVLITGSATCTYEPRGDHGLEGYQLGKSYKFEFVEHSQSRKRHCRVYPVESNPYYEVCGIVIFFRFFEEQE